MPQSWPLPTPLPAVPGRPAGLLPKPLRKVTAKQHRYSSFPTDHCAGLGLAVNTKLYTFQRSKFFIKKYSFEILKRNTGLKIFHIYVNKCQILL